MSKRNCNDINDPQLLVSHFREKRDEELNDLFKCFFESFYFDFKHLTKKFCEDRYYTKDKEDDLTSKAFQEGLLDFYFKLRTEGYVDKGEKIKIVFFSFNLNKLMALLKKLERRAVRESIMENDGIDNRVTETSFSDDPFDSVLLQEEQEKHEAILNTALTELGERGTNLIVWKKMMRLSNEEIAGRLKITPGSVKEEVYRAFKQLKKIIDRPGGKNNNMDLTLPQYENILRYLDAELSPDKEGIFLDELQQTPALLKYLQFEQELRGNLEFMHEKKSQAGNRVEDNFEDAPLIKSLIKKAQKEWTQEKLGSSKPMPNYPSPLREEFEKMIRKEKEVPRSKPWLLIAVAASFVIAIIVIIWLMYR
jgi:RNA polymerase sigma factor (sigma-70 family)